MDEPTMKSARIDRILAGEEEIVPSSGFVSAVMERVEREAAAPAPLAFPWKRAVPGIALACGVFGWGGVEFVRAAIPAVRHTSFAMPHLDVSASSALGQVAWVTFAIALSLGSWALSRIVSRWSD